MQKLALSTIFLLAVSCLTECNNRIEANSRSVITKTEGNNNETEPSINTDETTQNNPNRHATNSYKNTMPSSKTPKTESNRETVVKNIMKSMNISKESADDVLAYISRELAITRESITIMGSSKTSEMEKDGAQSRLLDCFSEDATVQVSCLHKATKEWPVLEYCERLRRKSYNYTDVTIEWNNQLTPDLFTFNDSRIDKEYYEINISQYQRYIGMANAETIYADVTRKIFTFRVGRQGNTVNEILISRIQAHETQPAKVEPNWGKQ